MTRLTILEAERLAGCVILAGFEGTSLPPDLVRAARGGALGGLILFRRNATSVAGAAELLAETSAICPRGESPVVAVDQEGGRVVRLGAPLTVLPPARRLGEIDDPELTERAGRLVGMELRAVGFTLDFAPVLDVDTNPRSPVIGDRSFSGDPGCVARHGLAFARGLRLGGVHPCAKHFPGHGDASLDSHLALPRLDLPRDRLERVELAPFAAWSRAGLGPVMTAHILVFALDSERPATLSPVILGAELRGRLGFSGAVLSDDLEMGAMTALGGAGRVAVAAVRAGVDGLLVCQRLEAREETREALAREAAADPSFAARLGEAADRLASLSRLQGADVPFSWLGSREHAAEQAAVLSRFGAEAP